MKSAVFFVLLFGVAYAAVITTVTVSKDAVLIKNGDTATLPCSYDMQPSEDMPPIIYWIKGKSVDDPNAEVVFKGFRYWNESHGEYREFFGDYQMRASVADLKSPSIKISGINANDEGRFWCMVAEWSGRQQEGTDADSIALIVENSKSYVDVTTAVSVSVENGKSATMSCSQNGITDEVTWYRGPYHNSDTQNFTHTEIGIYTKIGSYYNYNHCDGNGCSRGNKMEDGFDTFSINSNGALSVSSVELADSGRYWCSAGLHTASNQELEYCRSSVQLVITGYSFDCKTQAPGLYPDPQDCSMYYECVDGNETTYHRSCGYDGIVFHPDTKICDWAANVPPPCGTSSA